MARGWESKAIEQQQEDASRDRPTGPSLTPAERERVQRLDTLRLAQTATRAELGRATRGAHREMLEARLQAIEAQLAALAGDTPNS